VENNRVQQTQYSTGDQTTVCACVSAHGRRVHYAVSSLRPLSLVRWPHYATCWPHRGTRVSVEHWNRVPTGALVEQTAFIIIITENRRSTMAAVHSPADHSSTKFQPRSGHDEYDNLLDGVRRMFRSVAAEFCFWLAVDDNELRRQQRPPPKRHQQQQQQQQL